MKATFRALSNPAFRVVLLTIFISNLGSAMQDVAQGWLVLELTGSSVWLGIVAACFRAPFVVLAPIGGVLADRYDRRALLGYAQVIQLVPAIALAVLVPLGLASAWHFVVASLFLGIGNAIGFPTTAALQRDLVDKEALRGAVAVQVGQFHLARALGPLLATGLFAIVGVSYAFHVNALSYVPLMLVCFWGARRSRKPSGDAPPAPRIAAALREGIAYAGKDKALRVLLIACAIVGALLLSYPALFPMIAKNLGAGASGNAYLGGATGAGAFAGALLMPMIVGNRSWVVVLGSLSLVGGLALVGLGWAPELWSACVFAGVASLAGSAYMTATASTLQLLAPRELQGRVMSLNFVAFNAGVVIGSIALGALAEGAPDLFLPLAIAGGLAVLCGGFLFTRSAST